MLLKLSDSVEPASQPQTAYLGHTYALALNVQRVVSDAISCLPRYFLFALSKNWERNKQHRLTATLKSLKWQFSILSTDLTA